MALPESDVEKIRRYLGYPGGADYRQMLSDRCLEILDELSEDTVKGHLRQLDRLQQQLTNTAPFAAQTFSSGAGGTNQYLPGQRMASLHQEANQYIDEIASTIRMGVHRRIYGQSWGGSRTMR